MTPTARNQFCFDATPPLRGLLSRPLTYPRLLLASDTGETYYLQPESKVTDWNPPATESVVDDPSYSQIPGDDLYGVSGGDDLPPPPEAEAEVEEENPYGVVGAP